MRRLYVGLIVIILFYATSIYIYYANGKKFLFIDICFSNGMVFGKIKMIGQQILWGYLAFRMKSTKWKLPMDFTKKMGLLFRSLFFVLITSRRRKSQETGVYYNGYTRD